MEIVFEPGITGRQKLLINAKVRKLFPSCRMRGLGSSLLVEIPGGCRERDGSPVEALPGVARVVWAIAESCPRARKSRRLESTSIAIGGARLGRGTFTVIAGPCAVENEKSYLRIAAAVKAAGAQMLRGALFKPRTSPYSFQGIGLGGLEIILRAKKEVGLPVVTEVTDPRQLERVSRVADALQVGARNMRNYELLKELGRSRLPVMLKRSPHASLREWLLSAEYVLSGGNRDVFLCERGDVMASDAAPVLNLNMALRAMGSTHLPVIVDPSHGTGRRAHVAPLAKAAAVIGVHGIMVEVHDNPPEALSDGKQSLSLLEFSRLMEEIRAVKTSLSRRGGKSPHGNSP